MFPWKLPDFNAKKGVLRSADKSHFASVISRGHSIYTRFGLSGLAITACEPSLCKTAWEVIKVGFSGHYRQNLKKELMRRRFAFLALKKMDKAKTVFIQRRRLQAHLGKKEENLIATNSLVSLLMSCSLKYFFRDKWRHMFFLGDGRSSVTNMIRIR